MRAPRPRIALLRLSLVSVLAVACGTEAPVTKTPPASVPVTKTPPAPVLAFETQGKYPVGNATVILKDAARGRTLRVEIWYPAAESARAAADTGFPVSEFAPAGPERDQLAKSIAAAPDPGTSRTTHSARDAPPAAGGAFPVAAFSHCYDCMRFSTFSVAERLASHGIAVVAPDHSGGTFADKLAGKDAALDAKFLGVRAGDISFVLDRVLDTSAAELPDALRGRFDPARVGVFGHSFGGVTAGLVLMKDTRPRAGLALAVPMENPLLPGVKMTSIHVPLFFLIAAEDNSIGAIGDTLIEQNYKDANPPVWKASVKDAGHWSFTNICGTDPGFTAGCSTKDVRQTTGDPFTYLDSDVARGIAAAYTTAFLSATLLDDSAGRDYLALSRPADVVTAESRE